MTSMTGYGYEEVTLENAVVSVEIKSVNSRFLDLTINLPPYLNQLEATFKNMITEKVVRGKVDVYIRVKETESDAQVSVDENMAKAYAEAVNKVQKITGLAGLGAPLEFVLSQPGVLITNKNYDAEKYLNMIKPVFNSALSTFVKDREREGEI